MSAPKWASVIVVAGLVLFLADSLSARPPKRPPDGPLITVYAPHPEQFELALDEIALDWGSHSGAPAQSAIAIASTRVMEREAVLAWFTVTRAASPVDLLTVAGALIDLCISNRHSGHRKAGSSEPAMNERIRSGRLVTRLVIRQRVAMSSSTESGWPLASCALKCAHTHSSGLSSGA